MIASLFGLAAYLRERKIIRQQRRARSPTYRRSCTPYAPFPSTFPQKPGWPAQSDKPAPALVSCHGDESWGSLPQALASPLVLILAGVLVGLAILLVARRRRVPEAVTSQPFERGFDLLLEALAGRSRGIGGGGQNRSEPDLRIF